MPDCEAQGRGPDLGAPLLAPAGDRFRRLGRRLDRRFRLVVQQRLDQRTAWPKASVARRFDNGKSLIGKAFMSMCRSGGAERRA